MLVFFLQKFEVKDWPKDDYGKFFEGDSYIILNVSKMLGFFSFIFLTFRLLDSFLKKIVYEFTTIIQIFSLKCV